MSEHLEEYKRLSHRKEELLDLMGGEDLVAALEFEQSRILDAMKKSQLELVRELAGVMAK